jgi:hypothetical protein
VDDGGYLAFHIKSGTPYYEEYPAMRTAVINGFMASLFGLYEVAAWLDDATARVRFDDGIRSLEAMISHYTLSWYSLYDLDPSSPVPNVNSPRYHAMTTDYLRILAVLSGSEELAGYANRWRGLDTPSHRVRAYLVKGYKKVVHR